MRRRFERSTLRGIAAVRMGVLSLVLLVVAAGCSDASGILHGVGGASLLSGGAPQTEQPAGESTTPMTAALRAAYVGSAQENARCEYDFEVVSGRAAAQTPSRGFTAELSDGALRIQPSSDAADWSLALRGTGIGRGDDIRPVESLPGAGILEGNRATYHRSDGSAEWYLNGPLGVEQGFTLVERPAGDFDELIIELTVGGGLAPQPIAEGTAVVLRTADGDIASRHSELFVHETEPERQGLQRNQLR